MKSMKLSTIAVGAAIALISVPALSQSGGMKMDGMDGMSCCSDMASGFGTVNSVDLKAKKVNLSHDPIKKIGWGKMTMDFAVSDMVALQKFEEGDNVHFMLTKNDDGGYDVSLMMPIAGEPEEFKAAMKSMMGSRMMCDRMNMGDGMMDGMGQGSEKDKN
ncbi:copper-binding protein [Hyphococcus flavus]|uniref:Copper-binding protein n=1 Tax=Hyphococcus flavus TaxID=1866326 RepID=A0AAE9ZFS4_9PROT|nr:copper-binding protein [Hyphococcus flavus]WDI31952.1 copper-binding protein [Hyphococcus flavus]